MRCKRKIISPRPPQPVNKFFKLFALSISLLYMTLVPFSGKLSISSINCNSLNSSITSKFNRNLKVHGITKLATDIIFLCDVRLSNRQLVSSENEIKKAFMLNMYDGYECYFNSSQNKRGVGILINKKTFSYSTG
jgi:exonuclease III